MAAENRNAGRLIPGSNSQSTFRIVYPNRVPHVRTTLGANRRTSTIKAAQETAKPVIDRLPEQATWGDIPSGLYVNQKIEADLAAVAEGKAVAREDAKRRWRDGSGGFAALARLTNLLATTSIDSKSF